MAASFPDDSTFVTDGAGGVTCASVTASGNVGGATLSATGAISAASLATTANIGCVDLTASGDISGATVASTGPVTRSGNAGNVRTVAADAAVALASTDDVVLFSTSGAGTNAITNASMATGQRIFLVFTAIVTGTYEMASVIGSGGSGTLTFNAANESAEIVYDGTNIRVVSLNGATVV